jgi:hypothetical protein
MKVSENYIIRSFITVRLTLHLIFLSLLNQGNRDSSVGLDTRLQAGRPGFYPRQEQ